VIAVIGILAALLFPAFARARRTAYRTTCAGNLKQIGLAVEMYQADNNRFYPGMISSGGTCAWADRLTSYIKSPATFQCPAYPEGVFKPGCPDMEFTGDPDDPDNPIGGRMITNDGGYDLNTMDVGRPRSTSVLQPSLTPFAMDGRGLWLNPGSDPTMGIDYFKAAGTTRHDNGSNILFCDGHVKWLRVEQMLDRSLWRADGAK